jgi:uncharacterized protein (DUF302 family)
MPVVIESSHPFHETIQRLIAAIDGTGATVFTSIDQAAAAARAGLSLRPTVLIVFGNPKGGTPLMDAFPLAALDLPLKLIVWDDGGAVRVAYTPASAIAERYAVTGYDALIAALDATLATVTASVTT